MNYKYRIHRVYVKRHSKLTILLSNAKFPSYLLLVRLTSVKIFLPFEPVHLRLLVFLFSDMVPICLITYVFFRNWSFYTSVSPHRPVHDRRLLWHTKIPLTGIFVCRLNVFRSSTRHLNSRETDSVVC